MQKADTSGEERVALYLRAVAHYSALLSRQRAGQNVAWSDLWLAAVRASESAHAAAMTLRQEEERYLLDAMQYLPHD